MAAKVKVEVDGRDQYDKGRGKILRDSIFKAVFQEETAVFKKQFSEEGVFKETSVVKKSKNVDTPKVNDESKDFKKRKEVILSEETPVLESKVGLPAVVIKEPNYRSEFFDKENGIEKYFSKYCEFKMLPDDRKHPRPSEFFAGEKWRVSSFYWLTNILIYVTY